jgi:phenylacetate-CoA ligase
MSVEYFGAKITPDSVREVVYSIDSLAPIANTFRLLSYEDEGADKRMEIAVELVDGAAAPVEAEVIGQAAFERLAEINADFLNAWKHTAPADNMPRFTLHPFETGPFAGGQRKLKNEYVATDIVYDKLN